MSVRTYGPYKINAPGTQWAMITQWFGPNWMLLGQAAWSDPNTGTFWQKVEVINNATGEQSNILFQLAYDASALNYSKPLPSPIPPTFEGQDSFTFGAFAGRPPPAGPMMAQIGGVTGVGYDYSTLYNPFIPPNLPTNAPWGSPTLYSSGKVAPAGACFSQTGAGQLQTFTPTPMQNRWASLLERKPNSVGRIGPIGAPSISQQKMYMDRWFGIRYTVQSRTPFQDGNGRSYVLLQVTVPPGRSYQVIFDVTPSSSG